MQVVRSLKKVLSQAFDRENDCICSMCRKDLGLKNKKKNNNKEINLIFWHSTLYTRGVKHTARGPEPARQGV